MSHAIDRPALAKLLDERIPAWALGYEQLDALTTAVFELVRSVDDEVLVEDTWFKRSDLPEVLGRYMRSVAELGREIKALCLADPAIGIVISPEDALAIATALNGGTWVTDSEGAASRRAAMVERLRREARS